MISRTWHPIVIVMVAFILQFVPADLRLTVHVDEPPTTCLLALNDVLAHHFPQTLKDLVFYRQAIDRQAAAQQMFVLNGVIKQLNGKRTARIESAGMITEAVKHSKRILNIIFVDGIESFR